MLILVYNFEQSIQINDGDNTVSILGIWWKEKKTGNKQNTGTKELFIRFVYAP